MKILTMAVSGFRAATRSFALLLTPFLLAATSASATSLSLGNFISNPTFSGGTVLGTTSVSLTNGALTVTIAPGDIGAAVQLFVAAYVPAGSLGVTQDTWFCLTKDGWQSVGTAFTPIATGLAAGSSTTVTLLQNANISALPKAEVYMGYGTSLAEMLQASRYKAIAAVR